MYLLGVIVAMFVTISSVVIFTANLAYGKITRDITTQPAGRFQDHSFFQATTTTATSTNLSVPADGAFRIAGAKKVTFYFSRGGTTGANTGTSRFELEVSPDGTNWYDFNRMMVDNTATSTAWTSTSTAITAATSTVIVSMDLFRNTFYAVRCIVYETTDGEHTCKATAEF